MVETGKNSGRRPRVLVEAPPYPWHYLVREAETLFSCDVTCCGGPVCTGQTCPAAAGQPCAKAGEADVIVAGLGLDTETGRSILQGLRGAYPDTPIIVPVWRADTTRHADLLGGCHLVEFPWTLTKFTSAVRTALARRPAEGVTS
jgi:hypothetical protein